MKFSNFVSTLAVACLAFNADASSLVYKATNEYELYSMTEAEYKIIFKGIDEEKIVLNERVKLGDFYSKDEDLEEDE